jgi:hypothetical protein
LPASSERRIATREMAAQKTLTLEEIIGLYSHLQEESKALQEQTQLLHDRILEVMREHGVESARSGEFEVVRVLRHYRAKLDVERARRILARYTRLKEATIETLDEAKAKEIIEDFQAQGLLSDIELPYEEEAAEGEALVVRRVEPTPITTATLKPVRLR